MTAKQLQTFNAWGMVSTEANTITVILSAVKDGKLINRTIKTNVERSLPTGTALIAVDIKQSGRQVYAKDIGENSIANHPDITKSLANAADWILQSAV